MTPLRVGMFSRGDLHVKRVRSAPRKLPGRGDDIDHLGGYVIAVLAGFIGGMLAAMYVNKK